MAAPQRIHGPYPGCTMLGMNRVILGLALGVLGACSTGDATDAVPDVGDPQGNDASGQGGGLPLGDGAPNPADASAERASEASSVPTDGVRANGPGDVF